MAGGQERYRSCHGRYFGRPRRRPPATPVMPQDPDGRSAGANLINRVVLPRVDSLSGYELLANLTLAALGLALVLLTDRPEPS